MTESDNLQKLKILEKFYESYKIDYELGNNSLKNKKFDEALSYYQKAIENRKKFQDAVKNRENAAEQLQNDLKNIVEKILFCYQEKADTHYNKKEYEKAIESYHALLYFDHSNYMAYYKIACSFKELGSQNMAEAFFKKVLTIKPDFDKLL